VVNRLSRKASIPIIARATYITPPGLKFGKPNVKEKVKEKREEDIFQGGPSIIEPTKMKDEVERPWIQKMMMRGTRIERPDYLGEGQELQDMSIDLNGMSIHLHLHLHQPYGMIRDQVGEVLIIRYSITYETDGSKYQ
jgi:hypothetical protein